ncbi:MAG: hypothetical protein QXO77_05815 [Saccharolobus sp.]
MKKKLKRSKILVVGGFTIDEIEGRVRAGGPPIYSSLGVMRAGGIPKIYAIVGSDFNFDLEILSNIEKKLIFDDHTIRFKIIISEQNSRKLILLNKVKKRIISIEDMVDGIIINPVCKEVELTQINTNVPLALDIQGFVRNCIENDQISYEKNVYLPQDKRYIVVHGNKEEFELSGLTTDYLFDRGFKEVIVSDGLNGFTIYNNKGTKYLYKPSRIGKNEVGNGDFLLGAYFTLRLNGLEMQEAGLIAGKLTEEFSNSELFL